MIASPGFRTRLIIGCIPLLVIAGIIEGFISPQPIPFAIKIGIGVITGITLFSYLLLAGREVEDAAEVKR